MFPNSPLATKRLRALALSSWAARSNLFLSTSPTQLDTPHGAQGQSEQLASLRFSRLSRPGAPLAAGARRPLH